MQQVKTTMIGQEQKGTVLVTQVLLEPSDRKKAVLVVMRDKFGVETSQIHPPKQGILFEPTQEELDGYVLRHVRTSQQRTKRN